MRVKKVAHLLCANTRDDLGGSRTDKSHDGNYFGSGNNAAERPGIGLDDARARCGGPVAHCGTCRTYAISPPD